MTKAQQSCLNSKRFQTICHSLIQYVYTTYGASICQAFYLKGPLQLNLTQIPLGIPLGVSSCKLM